MQKGIINHNYWLSGPHEEFAAAYYVATRPHGVRSYAAVRRTRPRGVRPYVATQQTRPRIRATYAAARRTRPRGIRGHAAYEAMQNMLARDWRLKAFQITHLSVSYVTNFKNQVQIEILQTNLIQGLYKKTVAGSRDNIFIFERKRGQIFSKPGLAYLLWESFHKANL